MTLSIRDLEPSLTPVETAKRPTLDPELLKIIQDAASQASAQAAHRSTDIAQAMINQALETVEKRLAGIEAPKPQILAVDINGSITHLKSSAVPYLGRLIINAKLGLNTLLVGPAGCGKTFAAHQLADALQRPFGHVCFTAGASETWLFGRQTPTGFIEGVFSKLYRLGGVFLADEMDAADANMLLALNTALANGTLFNPINGETYPRHADFVFIAGANTVGKGGDHVYTGRNRLDGATLNRMVCIEVTYNTDIEKQLCPDKTLYDLLSSARRKLTELKSDEIISTRTFDIAYKQLAAGIDPQDILGSITAGWPEETIDSCKLDSYPLVKPKRQLEHDTKADITLDIAMDGKDSQVSPHDPDWVKKRVAQQAIQIPAVLTDDQAKQVSNEQRIADLKAKLAAATKQRS